jgi:hypothetical protein
LGHNHYHNDSYYCNTNQYQLLQPTTTCHYCLHHYHPSDIDSVYSPPHVTTKRHCTDGIIIRSSTDSVHVKTNNSQKTAPVTPGGGDGSDGAIMTLMISITIVPMPLYLSLLSLAHWQRDNMDHQQH